MRHRRGQATEGAHLLDLPDLALGAFELGYFHQGQHRPLDFVVFAVQECGIDAEPARGAVRGAVVNLFVLGRVAGQRLRGEVVEFTGAWKEGFQVDRVAVFKAEHGH